MKYVNKPPPQVEVIKGLFIPGCANCSQDAILQAVGIVGAVIMPHNLFLHSALVKVNCINYLYHNKLYTFYFVIVARGGS